MTHDPTLADAWRGSLRNVDECLIYIEQYQRNLADASASQNTKDLAARRLPWWLDRYHRNLKAVSLYEEQMNKTGVLFARSQ